MHQTHVHGGHSKPAPHPMACQNPPHGKVQYNKYTNYQQRQTKIQVNHNTGI